MRFAGILVALLIGVGLVAGAMLVNRQRPRSETSQPNISLVRATGKCAQCHRQETSAVVHQFERSPHAAHGVNCLDCHRPMQGQDSLDHRGFVIAKSLTSQNCAQCHATEYNQFLRSRHAAPAWAAVAGSADFTPEQIAHAEKYHAGAVLRPANALSHLEGPAAVTAGCNSCHAIGKPNTDGSIGSCTDCHTRHNASVAMAREPQTCGQCHMGPDHSQIEIYNESKHGVIFHAQRGSFHLDADPKKLTTADMPAPTCSTCHMSGLEGQNVTHDTSERLSWYLFAAQSEKRPAYARSQDAMKETCLKCHTRPAIDQYYTEAEEVVQSTNDRVAAATKIIDSLRAEGLLTPAPFDEPIEFVYFDYWHYWGRTAKHGAFMGGADFVQWHGNYELLRSLTELEAMAAEIRRTKKETQEESAATKDATKESVVSDTPPAPVDRDTSDSDTSDSRPENDS
ncbi:ammonia-forming cytochrome c nitrite reductase subunit c552 [Lignipirellula cremea]|uniref:Hydroxylamine oxidoreductase n=1 Tax=Lignipirellula cremea TaxID=2528010 RepID=A0A518DN40_9BACT|nr:ammonia-forming cytochrome c nitrite reductase subunit c552 [Lignipirellula cremea]QDU93256.1 Hydroxylamine oxidoreductase precursor [Lignipirellula cremea]